MFVGLWILFGRSFTHCSVQTSCKARFGILDLLPCKVCELPKLCANSFNNIVAHSLLIDFLTMWEAVDLLRAIATWAETCRVIGNRRACDIWWSSQLHSHIPGIKSLKLLTKANFTTVNSSQPVFLPHESEPLHLAWGLIRDAHCPRFAW